MTVPEVMTILFRVGIGVMACILVVIAVLHLMLLYQVARYKAWSKHLDRIANERDT